MNFLRNLVILLVAAVVLGWVINSCTEKEGDPLDPANRYKAYNKNHSIDDHWWSKWLH